MAQAQTLSASTIASPEAPFTGYLTPQHCL
jgi:hypothetical protein